MAAKSRSWDYGVYAAAERFYDRLYPGRPQKESFDNALSWGWGGQEQRAVASYVRSAFLLYAWEWQNQAGFDIADWEWPFNCLARGDLDFEGNDEPWAVLLREAVWVRALGTATTEKGG